MNKPRVLIPMSLQFSVRYLLRTGLLREIAEFAQPVILLGWQDESLERELSDSGCEVHPLLKAKWGADYERLRALMNLWHLQVRKSPSTAIRDRRQNLDRTMSQRFRKGIRQAARQLILSFPGAAGWVQRRELDLFWSDTNALEIQRTLQQLKIDAVFCLTPFLVDEEMTVRICASQGIPSSAAILSFDNITTRPWMPITFDQYLLWNQHNVDHLHKGYPQAAGRDVRIVGSPQFDFYWKPEYLWSDEEWRRRLALPAERPVLLFAGGYFTCAPQEPRFLGQLDDAIEAGEIPGKPVILFRRHPVDPIERWQPVLNRARNIVLDNPWQLGAKVLGHTNVGSDDICKLASTLFHCAVHVNVASTMSIDGAIFDKYQVGPAYDDSPSRKYHRAALECYRQEHFLPILHANGIDIARTRQQLIAAARTGFTRPEAMREGRERIVKEICTFNDGRCTQRVAAAVREFVGSAVPRAAVAVSSSR